MFVLIWATLLFSVRGSNAGASVRERQYCPYGFCITLTEREITAEAGLCVVIPCSFTTPDSVIIQHTVWYKCEPNKQRCDDSDIIFDTNKNNRNVQPGFKGRVSLLESDQSQKNCSIVINDLTASDSGSYQLRVKDVQYWNPNGFTFSFRTTVSVKDLSQKPTVMIPPLTEGQQTTLTCTAPGLCSGSVPTITWMWRGTGKNDSHITGDIMTENLAAVTQRHSSTLTFNSSAEHHGSNVTCKVSFTGDTTTEETVTLNVTYMKKPGITGDAIVKEGDTLNLTCSVESFPPSLITWTKLGLNTNLQNGIDADLQNDTGLSTLIIPNVTAEHSGRYICTAKHVDSTPTVYVDVTVTWFAKILNGSGCVAQSAVLTCGCISQGVPLPTIKWPLMKNHNEYSVITTVSNHTVNSTITLTVKDHSNTAVECVSSNENGEAKEKLTIIQMNMPEQEGQSSLLKIVSRLDIIIAFLTGVLLSATLCCLAKKCHREKQKSSGNLDVTLEMVTTHEDPLIHAGQAVEDDQTHYQEAPKDGAEAVEKEAPDLDGGPKDAEYASIDFSVLKKRSARGAAKKQETTETEYAEIKREEKVERQDSGGVPDEVLECKEEESVIAEDEEIKHCVPEEEEAEDAALYSNVKDIMGEI
ncbi:sialic acid-binding Ig-like lectin 5 [Thunnus albacares]|uniref:sialic acid-binding Ig-like lectin 5 n=1 Tax=Thunnus albacares TaxID=8236 RepID=UPI001CF6520F|nr:sialic acid-binding Ig-like lectin 5 [Thunnus albacares]